MNIINLDTYAAAFNIADVFKPASYFTSFGKLATDVITILVSAAGAIAIIFIIISGIKLVTASGDPKKISSATGTLSYSLIGLAVVVLAFIIIQVVEAFFHVNVVNIGTDIGGGEGIPACTLNASSVAPGETVTVNSSGGLSGTIGMQGAYGSPVYSALGNLPANGSTTITVPSGAILGLYVVRVGGYGVGCKPDLSVITSSGGSETCALGSSSVAAGSNLGFGYDGFTAGQKIFIWDGWSIRYDLGTTLTGPQLKSFTIPSSAPPKSGYGGFIENIPNSSVSCGPVTVTPAPTQPPSILDTDGDGFSNALEAYIGTNPNKACSLPGNTNSWPVDYDNSGKVDYGDFNILTSHWNAIVGDANWDKRYDLNADGKIDNGEFVILTAFWNKTCISGT